jgi:hypothetical protein
MMEKVTEVVDGKRRTTTSSKGTHGKTIAE